MTKKLNQYFKDYAAYHKNRWNKVTHYFGITFIVVSLFGLLSQITVGPEGIAGYPYLRVDGGVILLFLGAVWYLFLDWKISVPFILVIGGLYFLGRALSTPLNWVFFTTGWVLQGIGHYVFEKKSPAFFKNLTHVLIGPLWIFARLVGYK
jgi:uncharacterized membrane protein YGL010W